MDGDIQHSVLFVSPSPRREPPASPGAFPSPRSRGWAELWGRRGLALWSWVRMRGWAHCQLSRQLFPQPTRGRGREEYLRISCPSSEGHWVKEEVSRLRSPPSHILLPFSFPLSGFLLSGSRFPQQQGHKIHSLAFRSLMGRPSVCTVVLLLTYFCKAGIFPSKN